MDDFSVGRHWSINLCFRLKYVIIINVIKGIGIRGYCIGDVTSTYIFSYSFLVNLCDYSLALPEIICEHHNML